MKDYLKIKEIKELLNDSDAIVLGIGSGMSAAGGIDYLDKKLVEKWYPEYLKDGYETIFSILGSLWRIESSDPQEYWGLWGRHIYHIRYEYPVTEPYKLLFNVLKDKDFFIITTNADSQVRRVGFEDSKIFAPQGDYCYFQCSVPCSNELYYNEKEIKNMVDGMIDEKHIDKKDIPYCPNCGEYLVPNLRCDDTFVGEPHLLRMNDYEDYIKKNSEKNIIFLEIGVGFNTPGIIRFPFENFTEDINKAKLIRINKDTRLRNSKVEDKYISLDIDILEALKLINK